MMKTKFICPVCCGANMELMSTEAGYQWLHEYYECPKCRQKVTISFEPNKILLGYELAETGDKVSVEKRGE